MKQNIHRQLAAYILAAVYVLVAFAVRWALTPLITDHAPLICFILASILAAWYGGLGPGLSAMVAGGMVGDYFFVQPFHTVGPTTVVGWAYLLLYCVVTGVCVGIIEALRRAQRHAEKCHSLAQTRGEQLRNSIREIGEAEAKIRELASVVESAQDPILSVTLDGEIKNWNAGAERLFGCQASEMIGRPLVALVPTSHQTEHQALFDQLKQGRTVQAFETLGVAKDGRHLDLSISLSPMKDGEGNIVGASAIIRDITELKRANAALRESEQRFNLLSNAAPLMIWMTNTDTQCTWTNSSRLAFTGRNLDQELGEGWMESMHPEDRPRWIQSYGAASEEHQSFQMEYRLRRSDGEYRWVLDHAI
ncbi:MAG TPA: PAS domain S-box protein, partial [Clostridia bacterium]|nr:PAS domain S-box protein [Clostridia bacterium]